MPESEIKDQFSETEVRKGSDEPDDMGTISLIKFWTDRIAVAEKYWNDKWFEKIKRNLSYARHGCDTEEWDPEEKYTTNLVGRHVSNTVNSIYARNPKPEFVIKERIEHLYWDGTQEQKNAVQTEAMIADQEGIPLSEDAQLIIQDIQIAEERKKRMRRIGRTGELVLENAMEKNNFKKRMRHQTYRSEIASVSFVKIGYEEITQIRPDVDSQLKDMKNRFAMVERMKYREKEGQLFDGDFELKRLQMTIDKLEREREVVLREGIVVNFPRTERVIVDPNVEQFDGFIGANWIAERIVLTADEILDIYGVDVEVAGSRIPTRLRIEQPEVEFANQEGKTTEDFEEYNVYEVYDLETCTKMVICEGIRFFLNEPVEDEGLIDDGFPYVALVFGDSDDLDNPVPPSEVDRVRHAQDEYNRSREALRMHRWWNLLRLLYNKGAISEEDVEKMASMEPGTALGVDTKGGKLSDVFASFPTVTLDQRLFSDNEFISDIVRATGTPESAWGGGSYGTTATEATIAADVRSLGSTAAIDRMDTFLSEVMSKMFRVGLRNMSESLVKKIVGQGAVWPSEESRADILDQLEYVVKAGSSGKPNKSHELAKLREMFPLLQNNPNLDWDKLNKVMLETLESSYNIDDFIKPGAPSIAAQNAMAGANANGGGAMNAPQSRGAPGASGYGVKM